jgi:hypothetical protein
MAPSFRSHSGFPTSAFPAPAFAFLALALLTPACRHRGHGHARAHEQRAEAAPPPVAATTPDGPDARLCGSLGARPLPEATITDARVVPATTSPRKLPAHCLVHGSAPDRSNIHFVVAVPLGGAWNGRYQQVGSGGFAGFLPDDDVLDGLATGNAVAGTDDGHQAEPQDARWAQGNLGKVVDYGFNAVQETNVAARAILRAITGRAPSHSYFTGCSDGGREALMEAQRDPDAFDGIVAMAPANDASRLLSAWAWNMVMVDRLPGGFLSPAKLATIEAAALRACGDAEGIVEDPLMCRFDPQVLRCNGDESDACLTDAQISVVRGIYEGPKNPRTGQRFFSGLEPGAEAERDGWPAWMTGMSPEGKAGAEQRLLATGFFRYMLYDPTFDLHRIDFDRDVARAVSTVGRLIDSSNPDLRKFARHGKLIVLHGWSDPAIPPRDSIDYYTRVKHLMDDPSGFYRLFLAPGMLHCGGGRGPNIVPALESIIEWVEEGNAPDQIILRKHEGDDPTKPLLRAWPVCSYPAHAVYNGFGDRTKPGSWRCIDWVERK